MNRHQQKGLCSLRKETHAVTAVTHWSWDAPLYSPLGSHRAWIVTDQKLCVLTLRM